jgi:hypothetical protein
MLMSSAMAAAPASSSLPTRSASRLRGQGHWPISLRLASSMSTITVWRSPAARGRRRW